MDEVLLKYGIVSDFKSINRFMAGILSGIVIRRCDEIKRSQFMKFVYKGVLRDSNRNLITINNFGNMHQTEVLNGMKQPFVPFSHKI